MRENIATGEIPFRKAYLRLVVDRVEVGDHAIRIIGDTGTGCRRQSQRSGRCSQFHTEVAHPAEFEPVISAFEAPGFSEPVQGGNDRRGK